MAYPEDPWYSTKTVLDWLLYHHVFRRVYLAWFAPEFDTYKRTNPRSSNPWELYRAYHAAWFDQDPFEPYVAMKRQSLSAVIERKYVSQGGSWHRQGRFEGHGRYGALKPLLPLVYACDRSKLGPERLQKAGSARQGSLEFLIVDLEEDEFFLLFADFKHDPALRKMVLDGQAGKDYPEAGKFIEVFERERYK
jgi:hypothetical protein